jgi:hypothetical protein
MSEGLWIALLILGSWASLPIIMIFANAAFDKDVVKPGEDAHHH